MFASAQSVCTAQSESSISATFSSPLVNTTEPLSIAERNPPAWWKPGGWRGMGRREGEAWAFRGFLPLIKPPLTTRIPPQWRNLVISILYQGERVVDADACVSACVPRQKERRCGALLHPASRCQQWHRRQQIRCHSIQSRDNDLEPGLGIARFCCVVLCCASTMGQCCLHPQFTILTCTQSVLSHFNRNR